MNSLFVFAAQNTVVAFLLALVVYGLTRLWRYPPVAHMLWLLVLLKLVAPPVMRIDWPNLPLPGAATSLVSMTADESRIDRPAAESQFVDRPAVQSIAQGVAANIQEHDVTTDLQRSWAFARPILLAIWLGGAALCALIAGIRIVRFERLLRGTLPAPERLQRLAVEIAGQLEVRRMPEVRYVESVEVPLLWCAGGRPTIVLPMRLLSQLDDQQAAMILAHELAHLRRRDHWVRVVELIIATLYWWNPLVWAVRRQIHQAEDLCCDAWVRSLFPDDTKRYAEVVLQAAESLSVSRTGMRLLLATPLLRSLPLKARIEMILQSRFAPHVSIKSMFVIALLAVPGLLSSIGLTKATAQTATKDGAPASSTANSETPKLEEAKPDSAKGQLSLVGEFPFIVKFEQGATRFLEGDDITIEEIRGTAETFIPGHLYWIKGTYKLGSRDEATLAAYITAMDAANGRNTPLRVQSTIAEQGNGAFTLFLPMPYRGWPHVSFYPPPPGGEGFGGNYFGTGDSVLKRWWGSKEAD